MDETIAAVRSFNRFYTRFAGVLEPHFLGTEMGLAEARMLYEIANRDAPVARELQQELGFDAGYASRILKTFESRGWITRGRGSDARQRPIALTDRGRAAFADLDRRQRDVIADHLAPMPAADRATLSAALDSARGLLGGEAPGYAIRTFRTGDLGLLAARQAVIYAEENGWGAPMEALLLEVCARFRTEFKPGREQCWIAERAGTMAGSVFVEDGGDGIAKLRLLYVEPSTRGLGIGGALVDHCIAFAREAGYSKLSLWTHTVLEGARRVYATRGFAIVSREVHHRFGKPEQGETWELALTG